MRSSTGDEFDFVIEWQGKLLGIEVKATANPNLRRTDDRVQLVPEPTPSEVPEQRRGTVLNAERLRRLAEVRMSADPHMHRQRTLSLKGKFVSYG